MAQRHGDGQEATSVARDIRAFDDAPIRCEQRGANAEVGVPAVRELLGCKRSAIEGTMNQLSLSYALVRQRIDIELRGPRLLDPAASCLANGGGQMDGRVHQSQILTLESSFDQAIPVRHGQ